MSDITDSKYGVEKNNGFTMPVRPKQNMFPKVSACCFQPLGKTEHRGIVWRTDYWCSYCFRPIDIYNDRYWCAACKKWTDHQESWCPEKSTGQAFPGG